MPCLYSIIYNIQIWMTTKRFIILHHSCTLLTAGLDRSNLLPMLEKLVTIFVVETAHSGSPNFRFEEKMKDYPSGTWIILKVKPNKEGLDLICVGYKYNKKKVLAFLMTRGSGSTKVGESYEACFQDKYGNVCTRHVMRPAMISQYFSLFNCVDLHNQSRQFDLVLEEQWVTQNPYFRLYIIMIGMIVVDVRKIKRLTKIDSLTIKEYVDVMTKYMIQAASNYKIFSEVSAELNVISISRR